MSQNIITGREQQTIAEDTVGPITLDGQKDDAIFSYDFTSQGGAIGTIWLRGPLLPLGAVITDSYIKVIRALTSSAAGQVAVGAAAAGDIQTAAAVSGAPWSTTGLKDTVNPEPGTESSYILMLVNGRLRMDITVGALTDGAFKVIISYDLP